MSHSKYSDSLYKFHGTGGNKLYDTVTHKDDDSPPPYNGVIDSKVDDLLERLGQEFSELYENPVEILEMFDTVVLLDDSSSMKYIDGKDGQSRWEKAQIALAAIAEFASRYDDDGIDIHFMNTVLKDGIGMNLKSRKEVLGLFSLADPHGGTYLGKRIDGLLVKYLKSLPPPEKPETEKRKKSRWTWGKSTSRVGTSTSGARAIKRLNLIVITDGLSYDSLKDPIVKAAKALDASMKPLNQVGIQFVQIGNDKNAAQALQELDDDLRKDGGLRDIVDTTPYDANKDGGGDELNAGQLIKMLLGGVNRGCDEKGAAHFGIGAES